MSHRRGSDTCVIAYLLTNLQKRGSLLNVAQLHGCQILGLGIDQVPLLCCDSAIDGGQIVRVLPVLEFCQVASSDISWICIIGNVNPIRFLHMAQSLLAFHSRIACS